MRPYVVQRGYMYLSLVGPFAYDRWNSSVVDATLMSYAKAHACAAAFGGGVVPAESRVNASPEPPAPPVALPVTTAAPVPFGPYFEKQ